MEEPFLLLLRALQQNGNRSLFSLGGRLPGLPPSIDKFCTCCGLASGFAYEFRLAAVNALGVGPCAACAAMANGSDASTLYVRQF